MAPTTRRERLFRYELQPDAFEILRDLDPQLGRLEVNGEWVANCEEIARQGGVRPNSITELKRGNIPLTENTMSALVGVAVINGMDPDEAHRALIRHVDMRPRKQRRSLQVLA